MQFHDKLWVFRKEQNDRSIQKFADELGVSKIAAKLLLNRGIESVEDAKVFLEPKLDNLYDPFLLKGTDIAVERINKAMNGCEAIWIYGSDYIDGIACVSILCKYFKSVNYKVDYYIHDGFQEEYGISHASIDYIKSLGGDLIICADCQINSNEIVKYANSIGIDLIIIDKQEYLKDISDATAVINPKSKGCLYPYKMLSCVGIVFKLIQGLTPREIFTSQCCNYLDIVALGTIADNAPITGENRILVKNGLDELRRTKNIGIRAFFDVYGLSNKDLEMGIVNQILSPLITANGKIRMAPLVVRLLLCENYNEAINISKELDNNNIACDSGELVDQQNMDFCIKELFNSIEYCEGPILEIDMELSIKDIGFNLLEEINMLAPFGLGNPRPVFSYKKITVESVNFTGKDKKQPTLLVQDENRVFDCIVLGCARDNINFLKNEKVDIVFNLDLSIFKGIETIQFKIKDLRRRSKAYYEENKLIQSYCLTFMPKINRFKYISQDYAKESLIDLRNTKDRAKYVFENLESGNSNLILINTAEGLIDLCLFLSDNNSFDILNTIYFNSPKTNKNNIIIVNPILEDIDLENYESIYVYDIPLLEEDMSILSASGKKIYILYNKSDCRALLKFLDDSVPNRNDLAKVYKYFKELSLVNQIEYKDIIKDMHNINLVKLRFCLEILSDADLLEFSQYDEKLNIKLLPPPKKKIDITATKSYKNINLLKNRFIDYTKTAFNATLK